VQSFKVQDSAIKGAVAKYFGQAPDDVYFHSSTPWGDLYKTYNWGQVQTTVSVVSATITEISANPTIMMTTEFDNSGSPNEGTYTAVISQDVQNTVETNWSMSETVTVGQQVEYGVSFLGSGAKGTTSLSFAMGFGQGGSKSTTVTLGSSTGVSVVLKPHQVLKGQLSATKGSLKIRVVYQASLSGLLAINYGGTYKGHHFYALPVDGVMAAGGINNAIQFTEDIEVGFFSNAKVQVTDPSGAPVQTLLAVAATAPAVRVLNSEVMAEAA
jgi:hypothetical protein